MIGLKEFFKKIQNRHTQELFVRSVIQEAVKTHTKVGIPIGSISFSSGTVVFKDINSALRSAIFIKKQAIIRAINEGQTIRVVTDLR